MHLPSIPEEQRNNGLQHLCLKIPHFSPSSLQSFDLFLNFLQSTINNNNTKTLFHF